MALLPILKYPDPRLATKAATVTEFDDKLKQLAADMAETMYKAPGVGLAATQVDRHIRLIVIDITEEKNDLKVLVNPELVESSEETKPLGRRMLIASGYLRQGHPTGSGKDQGSGPGRNFLNWNATDF